MNSWRPETGPQHSQPNITLLPAAGRVVVPDLFIRPAHDGVEDVGPWLSHLQP